MALTQATLSTKIQAEIIALYGAADDAARLKQFADALAKAIVDEIQQNAEVSVNVTSGSSAGTYAGTVN